MILLLLVIAVTLFSAYFSLAESSTVAMNDMRLRHLTKNDPDKSFVKKYMKSRDSHLSAIILLNGLTNITGSTIIGGIAVSSLPSEYLAFFPVFFTILMLFFAELIPKVFSANNPEVIVCIIARPQSILTKISYPLVLLSKSVLSLFGCNSQKEAFDPNTIRAIIKAAEEQAVITKGSASLMKNVLSIGSRPISDIMSCYSSIDSVASKSKISSIYCQAKLMSHKRLISVDEEMLPTGVVLISDIYEKMLENSGDVEVESIAHAIQIIHPSNDVASVVKCLHEAEDHLAAICSDEGGLIGVISTEDIVDYIVKS